MALQTIQFPPGGSLVDWTPGFSTQGHPIIGVGIDNLSGSWLSVSVQGLPSVYVKPYTLGWVRIFPPTNTLTILSQGPPNSNSTSSGGAVTVYAYDTEVVSSSDGNTYYTPSDQPIVKSVVNAGDVAPVSDLIFNPLLPAIATSRYRLYTCNFCLRTVTPCNVRGDLIDSTGNIIAACNLTPATPTNMMDLGFDLVNNVGISATFHNYSINTIANAYISVSYAVI